MATFDQRTKSAYLSEFKEIELLGKGGLEQCTGLKNHLDDLEYRHQEDYHPADSLSTVTARDGLTKLLSRGFVPGASYASQCSKISPWLG